MLKKIEVFNVISFESTHMAIKSEKLLLEEKLDIRVIPVPREITASCGLALKVELSSYDRAREVLKKNNIEISGFYSIRKEGLKKEVIDMSSNI